MRARVWLSFASVGSLLVLVVAAAPGCSGSTEETPAAVDSGADVAKEATADVVADAPPTECVDADITKLDVPDANLGDGGANTAECAACLKGHCSGELQVCQDDCDCREGVLGFFQCVSTGKSLQGCSGALLTAGSSAQSLGLCALNAGCADKCGVPSDAGPKNDAATDAPADGG